MKKNRKCIQTALFDIRGYFEVSVLKITRANCKTNGQKI